MKTKLYKLLSLLANNMSVSALRIADAVLRAACGFLRSIGAHATSIKNKATQPTAMLRRLAAHKNVLLAGLSSLSTVFASSGIAGRAPRHATPTLTMPRLTVEDHWRRATGIISAALTSFQRVKSLHAAATRQLDAADYALTQLLHDLRPAMALPADVSGLRAVLAEADRTASRPLPLREQKAALAA